MGLLSGVMVVFAALCAIMGILIYSEVIGPFREGLDLIFWFGISGILFVATIALGVTRSE